MILLQAAHASYYNYGYIYLQEIGAPKYLIGVIINIGVIAEIIFFLIADKKFQRFSVGSLLALAAFGSTIRWILVFAFPNVIVFSISQTLHAFSFAMGHYAFMKYLINNIPQTKIPRAQGIYSALALSWSTAVFTIFGGFLYEIEPRYAFIGMIICTIPSMLFALLFRYLANKRKWRSFVMKRWLIINIYFIQKNQMRLLIWFFSYFLLYGQPERSPLYWFTTILSTYSKYFTNKIRS